MNYNDTIIHWHFNWDENKPKFKQYEAELESFLSLARSKKLLNDFKRLVKNTYNIKGRNAAKNLFQLADKFNQDSEFQKLMSTILDSVEFGTPLKGSYSKKDVSDEQVKAAMQDFNNHKDAILDSFNKIANFFLGGDDVEAFFQYLSLYDESLRPSSKKIYKTGSNKKEFIFDTSRVNSLNNQALGSLKSLASIYPNILSGDVTDQTVIDIYNKIKTLTDTLAGYAFEIAIKTCESFITKNMKEIFGQKAKFEHSASNTSSQEGIAYRFGTTDIKIYPDGNGYLKFETPLGISLKHHSGGIGNQKRIYAKIKHSTLGKMLDITMEKLGRPTSEQFEAITNIMLNTGRKDGSYPYKGWRNLVPSFNKIIAITGLAGSLTKEDLSLLLIINNKAFNILDILDTLFDKDSYKYLGLSNGITKGKTEKLVNENHEWVLHNNNEYSLSEEKQKKRSENILKEFEKYPINMSLSIDKSFLNKYKII